MKAVHQNGQNGHTSVHTYVCVYICTYVCTYICVHTYVEGTCWTLRMRNAFTSAVCVHVCCVRLYGCVTAPKSSSVLWSGGLESTSTRWSMPPMEFCTEGEFPFRTHTYRTIPAHAQPFSHIHLTDLIRRRHPSPLHTHTHTHTHTHIHTHRERRKRLTNILTTPDCATLTLCNQLPQEPIQYNVNRFTHTSQLGSVCPLTSSTGGGSSLVIDGFIPSMSQDRQLSID